MNKTDLDAIQSISRRHASRLEKRKENGVKTTRNGTLRNRNSPIDDITVLLEILDRVRIREAAKNLPRGA